MRTLELAQAALAAEALRLRSFAKRQARRGAFGVGALIFAVGVLVWASIVVFLVLALAIGFLWSGTVLMVINIVLCALCGTLAVRSTAGPAEVEAAHVRDDAITAAQRELTFSAMVGPIGRLAGRSSIKLAQSMIRAAFSSHRSPKRP